MTNGTDGKKRKLTHKTGGNRGMKTTMRNISKVLLLALPFLTACQKDMEADRIAGLPDKGEVEEGCFVVDYTTDEATVARGLDASCRIQSLDYLVYENSGEEGSYILKKRRSIPDIKLGKTGDDGEIMERGTSWPLTRENMTWAQREALKDTLLTSCNYKVVFVANAATDIWKEEVLQNADEIGVDKFEDGRLFLPTAQTFDDSNMYYMWTGELKGSEYSKETPASKQIVLERMINRVEVKLDETVAQRIEEQGVDNYVNSQLETYFDENYVKDDNTGVLDEVVFAYIDGINNQLEVKGKTDLEFQHLSTSKFKNDILGSSDNKKKVVNAIICENDPSCTTCVKHLFIDEMKDYFTIRCNWSKVQSAGVNYAAFSCPQAIGLDKQTKAENSSAKSIQAMRIASSNYLMFYVFGNNKDDNGDINRISSISFFDEERNLLFDASAGIIPVENQSGGNRSFSLIYNPESVQVMDIDLNSNSSYFIFMRNEFNLQMVMEWSWDDDYVESIWWTKGRMEDWLNQGITDAGISGTYNDMTLQLDIPKVEIVNPWTSSVNN